MPEVPEQWLVSDVDESHNPSCEENAVGGASYSYSPGSYHPSGSLPALAVAAMTDHAAVSRRGRKPGPRPDGPAISHVEAERLRRERLGRRFCELRAAVPRVSRMDKASLLHDAATYISELRGRVRQLEAAAKQQASAAAQRKPSYAASHTSSGGGIEDRLEVRMVGGEAAALRLTTATARHAPARLMAALRELDLPVQHARVTRAGEAGTVQDAVVDVPAAALRNEGRLRAALLHRLQQSDA